MAPGLAIGCVVNVLAYKVLDGKHAKHCFGWWSMEEERSLRQSKINGS